MAPSSLYRSDLAKRPLGDILFTIHQHGVPGIVQASRREVVKRVYLRGGSIVHASSSDRSDSLGRYLVEHGRLLESTVAELRRRTGRKRLGGVLVQERILSPVELKNALEGHVASILWSLFAWDCGDLVFTVGDFADPVPPTLHLPVRSAIKLGARKHPRPLELIKRLGGETVFEPLYCEPDELVEIELDSDEFELLRMVDGRRTVRELCQDGPLSPAENGKLVYAFQELKLVAPRPRGAVVDETPEERGPVRIQFKARKAAEKTEPLIL